jgi:glycosyltransferase involved in cell wall biosynthesis
MRIAFDHQVVGWQEYGGISRYVFELASNLATRHAQEVAVISPLYVNRYLAHAPSSLNIVGVHVPRLPKITPLYRLANAIMSRPFIAHYRPDIVHETYYSPMRVGPRSAKTVLTVYDMIHEKFSDQFSRLSPTRRFKALAVARADHIICISEQTRRDLVEILGVDPGKTSVVHLGFTMTNRSESTRPAPSARPYLLYVGSRGGYKNFQKLLRAYAASALLRANFDLICFGGGPFTENELNVIRELGLSGGGVRQVAGDDDRLAGYYSAATAFIYPSLYEGFGIPLLEAMSFDCPVVCSGVSSIPEVAGTAGEFFDPYDVESMRNVIERVVGDDALRRRMVADGQERIGHFSWQRCAQETLDIYRGVLA